MTEAEVAKDFAAVMQRIRQGDEIIIEHNRQPVAIFSPAGLKASVILTRMAAARGPADGS